MPVTVAQLITHLQKQPQYLEVAFCKHSEMLLLSLDGISIEKACQARPDGWIQRERPDMPTKLYLVFPGN